MRKVYIVEQQPRDRLSVNKMKLTFFLNEKEAWRYYSEMRTNTDYQIIFRERLSGESVSYDVGVNQYD